MIAGHGAAAGREAWVPVPFSASSPAGISNNPLALPVVSSSEMNGDVTRGTVLWLEAWALDSNDLVQSPSIASFFVFGVNVVGLFCPSLGVQWDLSHFSIELF